jgi:formate hydrogenlyase subunit 6/NADH:ubiquinone oxidoreductase subunit I
MRDRSFTLNRIFDFGRGLMGVASYVKDIKDTVTSVFEGMAITFSHLVRRPMTIQYPDKIPVPIQDTLPRRYGILEVDMDICTGCLAARGLRLLHHDRHRNGQATSSEFTHFDIDICKCSLRLCSEACPTGPSATPGIRGASYNPAGLVRHL